MAWKKNKIEDGSVATVLQPGQQVRLVEHGGPYDPFDVAAVFQAGRQVRNTDLRLPVPDDEILSARVLADGRIGIVTINGRKVYFTPAADSPAVAAPEA